MWDAGGLRGVCADSMKAVVTGTLCVLMAGQPLLAGTVVRRGPSAGGDAADPGRGAGDPCAEPVHLWAEAWGRCGG